MVLNPLIGNVTEIKAPKQNRDGITLYFTPD